MPNIFIVQVTDENRTELAELALAMYLGETCPYCKIQFVTRDDLHDAVWNGYTDYGRIAHTKCYQEDHAKIPE